VKRLAAASARYGDDNGRKVVIAFGEFSAAETASHYHPKSPSRSASDSRARMVERSRGVVPAQMPTSVGRAIA
jgi:hypothetical protein